ncbi:hydroxyacid dehydrogenase (plasmid) [Cupriavidus sp. KK10]|uniref:hydroxyacid dehydrogenase n=1 Tax=Cupriavidus sp. KK10 TaxID=1478019 RepID=UPI001BA69C1E|nr:hydroxyacid dehydrogenase [Cupriavidus sp. KK10]QUN32687.1 hydroxyacid dehydrogenase [Cupriavidus sp. KK10]
MTQASRVASRPLVLLTDPIAPEAHARLAADADVELLPPGLIGEASDQALRDRIAQVDGLIVRRQLPGDLFEREHRLRAVVRHGVGVDFIPVDRATAHGIPVANTPDTNSNAVAEYAVSAMLAMTRKLEDFDDAVRNGDWNRRMIAGEQSRELRGSTLGIIGFGAIGRRVAEIAGVGFGMKLLAHTSTPSKLPPHVDPAELTELFARSDYIVIACPLIPATRGMVNKTLLAHARPTTVLVNVARGPIIQQADLIDVLSSGTIGGAVLDVFEQHPLPDDSPLRALQNVLLTPHIAGLTQDASMAMGLAAVQTMLALLRGERAHNIVNPEFNAVNQETTK